MSQLVTLRRPSWQLLVLLVLALVAGSAVSCGGDFDEINDIKTLRIITVEASNPYPAPGDTIVLDLTFSDSAPAGPRPVQVTWIGGCVDPAGGSYLACYPQLAEAFAALGSGQPPPAGLLVQQIAPPELSGVPGAVSYELPIATDVLKTAAVTSAGVRVSTLVTFFAVCAGKLAPLSGEAADSALPLGCFDDDGNRLSAADFVFGYTQQFVFSDGRTNANPLVNGLDLDGMALTEDGAERLVARCAAVQEEGCGPPAENGCATFELKALVDDIAETDPDARDDEGNVLREVVWVDYYAEGGSFDGPRQLINDPARGYQTEFETIWTPPAEPGDVRIWAVVHDNRGGIGVKSGVVRVE